MEIKFYKYDYKVEGEIRYQGFEYFYSGNGLDVSDLEADVLGFLLDYDLQVTILQYTEISEKDYEQATGKPFVLGQPSAREHSWSDPRARN